MVHQFRNVECIIKIAPQLINYEVFYIHCIHVLVEVGFTLSQCEHSTVDHLYYMGSCGAHASCFSNHT